MLIAVTAVENFVSFQPNVQALVAGLTCICWRYCYHLNSRLHTFIPENATDRNSTIGAPAFSLVSGFAVSPLTYTSQIFNCNDCAMSNGITNNSSTDCMIQPSWYLLSRPDNRFNARLHPLRVAFVPCKDFFGSSYLRKFVSSIFYLFSIPYLRRSYCYLFCQSQPQSLFRLDWLWRFIRQLNVQVVQSVAVLAQLSTSWFPAFEFAYLIVTQSKFNVFPTTHE